MKELEKVYNPAEYEDKIYKKWEDGGYFKAEPNKEKEPFCIVIPPPNVTGQLHMGHALDNTLQDILIRYKRMKGFEALWLPGTDHAGIATQIKVEETLRKEEGKTRYDLGRDEFLKRVWEWKEQYGGRIVQQLKKLGSSCDWSKQRFTMDEGCSEAVKETFINLYNKGLIYRGFRIINWCPDCQTALSDAEVEYSEQEGNLWHIKYPLEGSEDYIVVATTRPETMLGDTGVAIAPDDERYTHLIGKNVILPLVGRKIPVFTDEYVEKEFGTGCVKVTPCHDPNDFEMGTRHGLEQILVIGDEGEITFDGPYKGLDRYAARKKILEDLEAQGYLIKTEKHMHNVGGCYRCGTNVEPLASKQWFVKMKPLAEDAIKVVQNGEVRFVPDRFSKIYLGWMENVRDWCISRQLWWGHRIPVYYCDDCGHMHVSKTDITKCEKCGSANIKQDEDVLDTWFSSALWPFSTLGWPKKTEFLDYFYPTSTLVTGYDIIFFWVARMIFSGMAHMKEIPFKDVLIHGLVRDSQGRKMSKSLGNGIDPLEIIEQYGADALRFTLATGNAPGNDMRFSTEKVEAARNFANKIWNASRFVLMNLDEDISAAAPEAPEISDKWILSKLNRISKEVSENLDKYEIGIALAKLYDFIWSDFCDWYIELVKPRLFDETEDGAKSKKTAKQTLCFVLSNILKLMHPFMPFITEEIYLALPHESESVIIAKYPEYSAALDFSKEEQDMEKIMALIKAIRNRRAEMGVPPSKKASVYIDTKEADLFDGGAAFIIKLASASEVYINKSYDGKKAIGIVTPAASCKIPMGELVDIAAEIARQEAELKKIAAEIERVDARLSNEGFMAKAPQNVIDELREKREKFLQQKENLEAGIAEFKNDL